MSIIQVLRETHPYRLLLMGTLALVVLAQMVALAMIVQGQVRLAEQRELQARSAAKAVATTSISSHAAPANDARARQGDGLVKVGYVRHP